MYHSVKYSGFHIYAAQIPIAIILGWAILLYTVLQFTDKITVVNGKPLLDGLILLGVDLVLDPVAVRSGLWTWNLPGDFLGIPYNNFFAWLLYTVLVSFAVRNLWYREKSPGRLIMATALIHAIGVPLGFFWFTYSGGYKPMLFWTMVASATVIVLTSFFRTEYLKYPR